uniref:Uncharacterized protein n=1 Tax=Timema cristinae TaxID=61476 RepID=A0A7R9CKS4_TIMCR|nr:unnamed protein product [Timema cristinae]
MVFNLGLTKTSYAFSQQSRNMSAILSVSSATVVVMTRRKKARGFQNGESVHSQPFFFQMQLLLWLLCSCIALASSQSRSYYWQQSSDYQVDGCCVI